MSMPKISLGFGVLFILMGVGGYVVFQQPTALIPAGFGLLFVAGGGLSLSKPELRKHAMHGVAGVALLGIMGTFRALLKLPTLLSGGEVDRAPAVWMQSAFCLLSLVFLVLCVRSFIEARRSGQV
jgi:hypothetical protein